MHISIEQRPEGVVISLNGTLDGPTLEALTGILQPVLLRIGTPLVIDVAGAEPLSEAALDKLEVLFSGAPSTAQLRLGPLSCSLVDQLAQRELLHRLARVGARFGGALETIAALRATLEHRELPGEIPSGPPPLKVLK